MQSLAGEDAITGQSVVAQAVECPVHLKGGDKVSGIISGKKGFTVTIVGELPVQLQHDEAAANAWLTGGISLNLETAGFVRGSTVQIVDMVEVMGLKLDP